MSIADHARFGRVNIKIGEKRRQKFVATALDGGNVLGPTNSKDVICMSTQSPMLKKSQFKSNHSHGCQRTRHSIQLRMVHRLMKYGQRVWSRAKRNYAEKSSHVRIVCAMHLTPKPLSHYTAAILIGPRLSTAIDVYKLATFGALPWAGKPVENVKRKSESMASSRQTNDAGQRGLVLIDRSELWKGRSVNFNRGFDKIGRPNNTGRITPRRRGGGQNAFTGSSISNAKFDVVATGNGSNMTRTVQHSLHW